MVDNPKQRRCEITKIVVAEDEQGISMLIALSLRMEGYEVLQASDGRMALEMIRRERPDLVLLDVMMPHLSGYQVARALQEDAATALIPIIFVTAKGEIEDRLEGLGIATDYVCKPFAVPELLARVRAALRTHNLQEELRVSNERLTRLAVTDELTELANRRGFLNGLEDELLRARRFGHSSALLIFDLDHFKAVNDRWGHARGDTVLKTFARILSEQSRRVDKTGRLGGEEFVALLPNTGSDGAAIFASKVREATEKTQIRLAEDNQDSDDTTNIINITVSAGIAVFYPEINTSQIHGGDAAKGHFNREKNQDDISDEDNRVVALALLRMADTCLYQAKAEGRNRWVLREVHGVAQLPIEETIAESSKLNSSDQSSD